MRYGSSGALRAALEQRLLSRSRDTGTDLERLRRRLLFERVVARLGRAEPGQWVVKGGMALEVRLADGARLTKDVDLGLRGQVDDSDDLLERLQDALCQDLDSDGLVFDVGRPQRLGSDGAGAVTWRAKVSARMAAKPFGGIQLDISPRRHELAVTDRVTLSNLLDFAGVPAPIAEIVDLHRHAAEKYHAMLRTYGDRENTRVRDLVDLVIMIEHGLLDRDRTARMIVQVFDERDAARPPVAVPELPGGWPARYERLAAEHDLGSRSFTDGAALVRALWTDMFPTQET